MSVPFDEWLSLLRREYLDDYVREGGAAVKFAVIDDPETGSALLRTVRQEAEGHGYLVVSVDAARTKIHMAQDVFFEVARQVAWRQLAARFVRNHYLELGYRVPGDDLSAEAVAAANGIDDAAVLHAELRRHMYGILNSGAELAKDFRVAMLWLCLAETRRGRSAEDGATLIEWLEGDLRLVSALRPYLIFRKIGRHNARAMLSSLSAWCRMVGLPGMVVLLDVRRLAVGKRADVAEGVFYTRAGVLDAYEVLRQLIDATDDLHGALCVVLARPELFDDDRRGVVIYKALYERVWPDVQLRQRDNPLSALARIGDGARS
jgi:hypothetical protein